MKKIWKCEKCGTRIKGLGEKIGKPQKCFNCGSKEFK